MNLITEGYIPFDKSWMIRLGVIDLLTGHDDALNFLDDHYKDLGGDLRALYGASVNWRTETDPIDVGESGTLYRFLKFASYKMGHNRTFVKHGTLEHRNLGDTPETLNSTFEQLAACPTSQWASAYMLFDFAVLNSHTPGYDMSIAKPKLRLTREAIEHWERARLNDKPCAARYDETIHAQALAYLRWLKRSSMDFVPLQAEDYCFARAFGVMSAKDGKRWKNLKDHESDRVPEMGQQLRQNEITSKDHRVVQAIAMLKRDGVKVAYPDSVNKSWPQFWKFYRDAPELAA